MDGKGRATDNSYIENFFGTLKRMYVYLNPASKGLELYVEVVKFIEKYNRRNYQGIDRKKPLNLYQQEA